MFGSLSCASIHISKWELREISTFEEERFILFFLLFPFVPIAGGATRWSQPHKGMEGLGLVILAK